MAARADLRQGLHRVRSEEKLTLSTGYRSRGYLPAGTPLPRLRGRPRGESRSSLTPKGTCESAGSWPPFRTCRTRSYWRSSLTSRCGTGFASPGAASPRGGAGAGAEGQAGSGCSHGRLPPQGLSPLEEAGGRPVAVAARRPDRLQGECGWPGGPGPVQPRRPGRTPLLCALRPDPPLQNVNSRTARAWAPCRSVSRRAINAGWRSDHLGLLLPSLHGEIIFHSQQN